MSKGKNDMKWETNLKVISVSYLRFYFLIDCLGCIPTLITLNQNNCIFYFKFFRLLGLPKLFLQRVFLEEQAKRFFQGRLTSTLNIIQFMKVLQMLFFTIHILSCLWIRIGLSNDHDVNKDSWLYGNDEAFGTLKDRMLD